jgi:hypothetical protein
VSDERTLLSAGRRGKKPHAVRIDNNEMTSAQIDSSDAVGRWLVAVERIFI